MVLLKQIPPIPMTQAARRIYEIVFEDSFAGSIAEIPEEVGCLESSLA
jgi:hypothetical protein